MEKKEDYTVRIEKTTGTVPPLPPGIRKRKRDEIMLDLPLKRTNGNKVRIAIHDRKMEHVMNDVTVYIKWKDGAWYPSKNLNIWLDAFEMAKKIIEAIK